MKKILLLSALFLCYALAFAQHGRHDDHNHSREDSPHTPSKFRNLDAEWPSPNSYRTGSGAPGPDYWQNRANYNIDAVLDENTLSIRGSEVITYFNNSPTTLYYLWLQLDQNIFAKNSDTYAITNEDLKGEIKGEQYEKWLRIQEFDGGVKLKKVATLRDEPLKYTVVKTMMRVELPQPLESGQSFAFKIAWTHKINDQPKLGGRSGYEYFPEDKNYLFEIAQWFPRLCNYNDMHGWQNKPYLGRGEFCLPFGDYRVKITVPSDYLVGATGELQNADEALTPEQMSRLERAAREYQTPVVIASEAEARLREKGRATDQTTWIFRAENVRDFAFAASRKFIWDAMAVRIGENKAIAMSFYPKEGNPLWGEYSTKVVAHTLKSYSKHTVDYPYPVAISVHGPVWGMEYPMICFNGGRPNTDGTYTEATQNAMQSVIMHEVGHNFFPMIVNSDEREHAWMDEGFNSFVQFLTEQSWRENYPSRRGFPHKIAPFMGKNPEKQQPITTNPEYQPEIGNVIYGKTATALNILRETVMGRELFDYAFREYAQRWAFRNPYPADFFRTMEDASGMDLRWFWRGWFYSTDFVDQSLEKIELFRLADKNNPEQPAAKIDDSALPKYQTEKTIESKIIPRQEIDKYIAALPEPQRLPLDDQLYVYQFTIENKGGLVMPIVLKLNYLDGTNETVKLPAHIWKLNERKAVKVLPLKKPIISAVLDPDQQIADANKENNAFPR